MGGRKVIATAETPDVTIKLIEHLPYECGEGALLARGQTLRGAVAYDGVKPDILLANTSARALAMTGLAAVTGGTGGAV